MKKKLFYRLFGIGKISAEFQLAIKSEGLILSAEGIGGTITYLNFRSPRQIANWRRQWYIAALAVTETRLLAFRTSAVIIDVPFADGRFRGLQFSLEDETMLLIAFDAALFHDDWSGNIEYRFKTPLAQKFFDELTQKQKNQPE